MKYLAILEDGEIKQVDELQGWEHESIAAGILEIVRFHNGKYQNLHSDGKWFDL